MRSLIYPERFDSPDLTRLVQSHLNPAAQSLKAWAEEVRLRSLERFKPTELTVSSIVTSVRSLGGGEWLMLDGSLAGIATLAPPSEANAGSIVGIAQAKGNSPFTVRCPGFTINRHPSETFGRKTLLVSDGREGWWSVGDEGPLRWTDLRGSIEQAGGASALTFEAIRDTQMKAYYFQHNQNDALYPIFQMDHGWAATTVYPHIHFWPEASGTGLFALGGYWVWSRAGGTVPAQASWTAWTASYSITPALLNQHLVLGLFDADPLSDPGESDMLLFSLERLSSTTDTYDDNKGSGTPTANVGLLFLDVHYQAQERGSYLQFSDGEGF